MTPSASCQTSPPASLPSGRQAPCLAGREEVTFAVARTLAFFLPVGIAVLLGLPFLMLQNFTDGVFYPAYAMDFSEMVRIAGINYYAVRFGAIAPDALAFHLFGPAAGLVVVRYLLAGLCCALLFTLFARRHSVGAGLLASFLWAVNPSAIRLYQTAYSDVAGTAFLCMGIVLLLMPRVSSVAAFVAGCLLAGAASCHSHAIVAMVFLAPAVLAVRTQAGWAPAVRPMLWAVAGGAATILIAAGWFYFQFGLADLTSPIREVLDSIRQGHIARPLLDWSEVIDECRFWFVPVPALLFAGFAAARGRLAATSLFGLCGYCLFLLFDDLFRGGYSLSLFYYFSFALPALALSMSASAADGQRHQAWEFAYFAACAGGTVLLASHWAPGFWIFLVVVSAFVVVPGLLFFWGRIRVVAAGVSLAWVFALIATSPSGRLALGNYWQGDDLPLIEIAQTLARRIEGSGGGVPAFWYDDREGGDIRMVQSFFLHAFSKLKDAGGKILNFEGDERLSPELLASVGLPPVVVLAATRERTLEELGRLRVAGIQPSEVEEMDLRAGDRSMSAVLLTFLKPASGEGIDGLEWRAHRKARTIPDPRGWRFRSGTRKWIEVARAALPMDSAGSGFHIRLQVVQGRVGVELIDEGADDALLASTVADALDGKADLFLAPISLPLRPALRLRNLAPHGVCSEVIVERVMSAAMPD